MFVRLLRPASFRVVLGLVSFAFDPEHRHAREEELEDGVHVVDKHLLEGAFLFSCQVDLCLVHDGVGSLPRGWHLALLVPHFKDYDLIDAPVLLVLLETLYFDEK